MAPLTCRLFIWLATVTVVNGSKGDRHPWYLTCRRRCIQNACEGHGNMWEFPAVAGMMRAGDDVDRATDDVAEGDEVVARGKGGKSARSFEYSPPWNLRLLGWDCESECGYTCMTMHVEKSIEAGVPVQQYYGKWPFRRVWGIQELFASLFSAGNGLPHLYHLLFSRGTYNPPGHYMHVWYSLYPWMGINTWLWSTVFHARDVKWTEAADYFCALMNIIYALWVVVLRVSGPPATRRRLVRVMVPIIGVSMLAFYLRHVWYMWFVKFDYGYNMKVALVAGALHSFLWLRYLYGAREKPYARRGMVVVFLLNAAILLEVNDFPPVAYRLLDAHAIWHMVTIPLGFEWYRCLIEDASHERALASSKAT